VRLVFGCQPDIYTMTANGDDAHALADHEQIDDESDLSPDGSKVVFFSGRDGNAFLYVVNTDGTGLTRLTSGGGGDTSPRWSPDGSKIAFSQSGSLVVMNADASEPSVIMQSVPGQDAPPCKAGSFVGGWSPDGEEIVYYSAIIRSDGENTFWLCTIPAAGGEPTVLIDEPGLHAEPYWSPTGDQIVYRDDVGGTCAAADSSGCNYDVFVLDLETRETTNVTDNPAFDIEPTWSPDGEWILFASNRDDPNFDLYVVRPDGTELQRVLNDPDSKDSYPSWR
jgi:TolB protein